MALTRPISSLRIIATNVLVTLLLLSGVEVTLRTIPTSTDPRIENAYGQAEFLSPEFEQARIKFLKFVTSPDSVHERIMPTGDHYLANGDFMTRFITIREGQRQTIPTPSTFSQTIWFLGGSTMLGAEVPDAYTIPSLVALRAQESKPFIRTVNLGVSGASLDVHPAQLRNWAQVQSNDVVVVYFGVNDVMGRLEMSPGAIRRLLGRVARAPAIEAAFGSTRILNLGRQLFERNAIYFDYEELNRELKRKMEVMRSLAEWTRSRSARILFVLQPNVFVDPNPDDPDVALISSYDSEFQQSVVESYSALRVQCLKQVVDCLDLSLVLSELPRSPYLDWMHVSHLGNEPVAEAIHAELARRGWLADE